ncbi:MAG TPA: EAL domain-containing protein [Rubrivivax sp.]|nr:EAL domain-containing protein [Rubrivivax sp.]
MKLRWPSLSIRATVLATIVVGMVLPALVLLGVDDHVSRRGHEPLVQRNRAAVLVLATAVVTEPAWTLSEQGLKAAAERILQEPSVCAVEVRDLQPTQEPLTVNAQRCAAGAPVVVRDAPVLHEGQLVANLRLSFDATEVDQMVAQRQRIMWWLVAAQVVVGVVVLLGVLSLRLLRPIHRLKLQASTLAARDALPPQPWRRRDELGQLGQHLNTVRARIQELFEELETKNKQLSKMAMYDHLTGLPNRTLLRELFQHEAGAARRNAHSCALLFIDLDRFKAVNDTMGHAAGDELLLGVSRRLVATLREADIVCRVSGDEFLVLLTQAGHWEQVSVTAERLLRAIQAPLSLQRAAGTAQVNASIGIALFPADGEDFESLARCADLAMYKSKELGKGRYSFYQPELDIAFRSRLALERELLQAIARQELLLHYQPVFDVRSGALVGCEALVRWLHPQRGLLMPGTFIQTAEETGLIRELGLWTLDAACAQLASWKAVGLHPGRIAVNVSALQFRDQRLPQVLRTLLQTYDIQPGELELELTESTLMSDTEAAQATVASLRELGVALAIDDFGTGYSSLSYIKRLRPDKLKIDRSFVKDLPADADDRALTEAIVSIAQSLAITVVAEGVETTEQREYLLGRGCALQQGYLLGRPMPAQQLRALMTEREVEGEAVA